MTGEVTVLICGTQSSGGESAPPVRQSAEGRCYFKNGRHVVLFDEPAEGARQPARSILRMGQGRLEVTRRGVLGAHMVFEVGKRNACLYRTPYGSIPLGITATRIECAEGERELRMEVDYELDSDGAPVAECSIEIRVAAAT